MPGFADSFWTPDYTTGLDVLYGKLLQGVTENQQILTITNMRVAAEELYSSKIGDIAPALDRFSSGFTKDEGASVRKVGATYSLPGILCSWFFLSFPFFFDFANPVMCFIRAGLRRHPR
jgi:hypothetical protein